jgi:hypothetical protein
MVVDAVFTRTSPASNDPFSVLQRLTRFADATAADAFLQAVRDNCQQQWQPLGSVTARPEGSLAFQVDSATSEHREIFIRAAPDLLVQITLYAGSDGLIEASTADAIVDAALAATASLTP